MIKERDLLEKVISGDNKGDFFVSYDLYKEIYEFLAQPEEEGVYQKLLRIEKENYVEMLPSELWLDGYEAGKKSALLSKQPEQTEQEPEPLLAETKIEWYGKGFRQGVNEFAPPKPLTEDVIYALDQEGVVENMDDHQVRYVIRWIRRVEKAHGIGGGE